MTTTVSDNYITAETIAEIIQCDYQGNLAHNRNTSDEIFGINEVPNKSFDDFVNKYLMSNLFDYKEIKIEYDDELQMVTYSFPSFLHLLSTPILLILFFKEPIEAQSLSASTVAENKHFRWPRVDSSNSKVHECKETKGDESEELKARKNGRRRSLGVVVDKNTNYVVSYYQVNNFLPILLKSKNKIASLNKNLLIVPDGVILNTDALTEPVFAIEITNAHNLDKMRYKIAHSYTRFKRPNSYKAILLFVLDDNFDIEVEVWKKVPLPEDFSKVSGAQLADKYVNIPASIDRNEEYKKIKAAAQEAKYANQDRSKHKFFYYRQHKPYTISYDSCTLKSQHDEELGIPLHYRDIHVANEPGKDSSEHENSVVVLHYDEIRHLMGALIQKKVEVLKSDLGSLSFVEKIRNRAKKNFFDLCDHLDFPNV